MKCDFWFELNTGQASESIAGTPLSALSTGTRVQLLISCTVLLSTGMRFGCCPVGWEACAGTPFRDQRLRWRRS